MGTKMDFAVIFMAHPEKQPLATSPHKPPIWKRTKKVIEENQQSY